MTDKAMSPLRRRMIEDMTIRKLAPKTQHDYVQRVKDFAAFLSRPPDPTSRVWLPKQCESPMNAGLS
jgi:integrase/recombinase XerD